MKSLWKLAVVSSATALLVACGGGGGSNDDHVAVANSASAVTVDGTNGSNSVQAMAGQSIVFANGVPDFGTTASTTVAVSATPLGTPPPSFTISSGGATATGDLTFGSCIFTVKSSTFPAGSKLVAGAKITVSPCKITLATAGVIAAGTPASVSTTLTLNTVTSAPYKITVTITPSGTVQVNGLTVYTTTLSSATGA
jgi:hypothetical protein